MGSRKRNFRFRNVLALCTIVLLCSQPVYGADYQAGQSLVAKDQAKASRGFHFPGLEITWLDFGDDYIRHYSTMPGQFAEGIFTLPIGRGIAPGKVDSWDVTFDVTGTILTEGDYDEIHRFSDGMALVVKYLPRENESARHGPPPESQAGYIDQTGKEIIPLGKIDGLFAEFHEGLAAFGDYEQKRGYIDKAGKVVIPQIYLNAGDFSEGLAPVQSLDTKLWGYIDREGAMVIPMEYDGAEPFHDGVAFVAKNGLAGYIDKTGKTVIDFQFKADETAGEGRSFSGGLAVASDDTGRYGYIDKSGSFVIPAKYRQADPFQGDLAFVSSENPTYLNGYGSSYLINRKGERITPLWSYGFFSGETMEDGLFRVLYPYGTNSNQSFAVINSYGAEIIPASLGIKYISPFNEGAALILCSDKEGKMAVGLVKKPEDIDGKKGGRLIQVYLDGKQLDFADTDPVIENSSTLVPMRAVFESLGAEVSWDAKNQAVTGTKDGTRVSLKIGDSKGYVNGKAVELPVPAKIQNARTLVPLRFVAESLNAEVTWDDAARTVSISTK